MNVINDKYEQEPSDEMLQEAMDLCFQDIEREWDELEKKLDEELEAWDKKLEEDIQRLSESINSRLNCCNIIPENDI